MLMDHMRRFLSVGISCFFLSGCAAHSGIIPPKVWGVMIVGGAVVTAVDTVAVSYTHLTLPTKRIV